MADRSISQLPVAVTPLSGDELTVIVQNGVTKQTQILDIANAVIPGKLISTVYFDTNSDLVFVYTDNTTQNVGPIPGYVAAQIDENGHLILTNSTGGTTDAGSVFASLTQTFLTMTNEASSLPNSQRLVAGANITLTPGVNTLTISSSGTSNSLNSAGIGLIAKDTANTVVARTLTSGSTGISITNGNGQAGNPTIGLSGKVGDIEALGTSGVLVVAGGASVIARDIVGTGSQIDVVNQDGVAGNITISINDNPVLPGSGSVTIPSGVTAQRPGAAPGQLRFNTELNVFEGQTNSGGWQTISVGGGGVTSIAAGTGLKTLSGFPITSTGTILIDDTVVATLTGAQAISNKTITASTINSTVIGGTTPAAGSFTTGAFTGISLTNASNAVENITSTGGSTAAVDLLSGTNRSVIGVNAGTLGAAELALRNYANASIGLYTNDVLREEIDSNGVVKTYGPNVSSITPFDNSLQVWQSNVNQFQEVYNRNLNNGSDASADFVAYNDASDVNSYFIDMGINSSNFSSSSYPLFTPNSSYLFNGGGSTGQQSDMFIGTSNPASDIYFFTGGVNPSDIKAMINGTTGNLIIGSTTDGGEKLQVDGSAHITGAAQFGSTVLLHQDPTLALQAATKQYVDAASSTGIHVHTPVLVQTLGNLNATYTQGGTTFNITDITGGDTLTTSVAHGLTTNNQIWLYNTAGNGLSINTPYFVVSAPAANQLIISDAYGGAPLTGLTDATGLSYNVRANSGVGATLTNAGTQTALVIDSVTMAVNDRVLVYQQTNSAEDGVYVVTDIGSGSTNWVLTRASDSNYYSPQDTTGMSAGDYFYTQSGNVGAGQSHVLSTVGELIIGYTNLTYAQFSGSVVYVGGQNISVVGQTISLTGTVPTTNGGTGTSTVTTGDLLYGSATNTWSKLGLGSPYRALVVNAAGTQLEWNAIALNQPSAVSGQLGINNGGTNSVATPTAGGVSYGTGTAYAFTTAGTAGQVLVSNGSGAPSFQNISTVGVSTFSGGTTGLTPATATAGAITLGGTLNVANGGTGLTSLTTGYIPFGAGTSALNSSANLFWNNTNGRLGINTNTPAVTLSLVGTDAMLLPKGTTAQQPTGVAGYLRFNTDTNQFEGYNGSAWASVGGAAISNDITTASAEYPLFAASTSGTALTVYTSSPNYKFTPSTGKLEATTFSGAGQFTALSASQDPNFTSTGAMQIPTGTTGQRPSGATGKIRFNTTTGGFEGYNGSAWAGFGGGASINNDTTTASDLYPLFAAGTSGTPANIYTSNAKYLYKPSTGELKASQVVASNGIFVNSGTVSSNYTIDTGTNGFSVSPLVIASGVSVTTASGQRWVII